MLMREPVMQHAFAVVFAPERSRFENRQREQHEQAYCKPHQACDRFSVHGGSPMTRNGVFIVGHGHRKGSRETTRHALIQGELQVDFRRLNAVIVILFRELMNRVVLIALMLAAGLGGCANDSSGQHGGAPPKDPADYHGVPTDDRPPVMVPAAP
jgi:hypothetical protein